jgi:hypothetical protein
MGFSTLISLLNFLLNVFLKRKELLNDFKSFATSLPKVVRKLSRTNTFRKLTLFMIRFTLFSMLLAGSLIAIIFYLITFKGTFTGFIFSAIVLLFSVAYSIHIYEGLNKTSKYVSVLKIV